MKWVFLNLRQERIFCPFCEKETLYILGKPRKILIDWQKYRLHKRVKGAATNQVRK